MPTGYTADVVDGKITDLKPFVLQCARAFGACVSMRDEPWSTPIPERFEPSAYHTDKLNDLRAERDRLMALKPDEAEHAAAETYAGKIGARAIYFADKALRRERYDAMLAAVEAYDCPHGELKAFMLEQLRTGREFDCPDDADRWYPEPEALTGSVWLSEALESVEQDIRYHTAEYARECARIEGANVWIAVLRESLR